MWGVGGSSSDRRDLTSLVDLLRIARYMNSGLQHCEPAATERWICCSTSHCWSASVVTRCALLLLSVRSEQLHICIKSRTEDTNTLTCHCRCSSLSNTFFFWQCCIRTVYSHVLHSLCQCIHCSHRDMFANLRNFYFYYSVLLLQWFRWAKKKCWRYIKYTVL